MCGTICQEILRGTKDMEQQIQDLIASIRKEGIDTAKAESGKIIADAEAKAASIISSAEAERDAMLAKARKDIELEKSSAEATIKQAARDVSLSLRKSIEDMYSSILRDAIAASSEGDGLISLLRIALEGDVSGKAVEIPDSELSALRSKLSVAFADKIRAGMEVRPSSSFSAGFRIAEKDGSGYIDYSDEECVKLLMPYLSESLREILG